MRKSFLSLTFRHVIVEGAPRIPIVIASQGPVQVVKLLRLEILVSVIKLQNLLHILRTQRQQEQLALQNQLHRQQQQQRPPLLTLNHKQPKRRQRRLPLHPWSPQIPSMNLRFNQHI